ncbi:MAG: DUF362 domain-containing protein [Candidatus Adiutrix sp.]|jgi:uncharacterized protein (DUF362 family)|nr:DUF362 domain-containing protein [Candidatus Adiutrix sp.]
MDRRSFLKYQAAGLMWLAGGSPLWGPAGRALADDRPDVAVVKGPPGAAARAAVEMLGGMGRFVKTGQKVVIKPNMSFARAPETAANTHPEVVKEILLMCREAGAGQIRILDHSLQDPQRSLEMSGILAACDGVERGLCHHLMEERFYRESQLTQGLEMTSNRVMRDVLEADVLIAVPVAKSHGGAGVSLSLKGQMGLIWDRRSMHSRYSLDQAIVDLNTRLKPHLAVIDATRAMTTGGPGGPGKIISPGEVIASADPVAADATAVAAYEWYGRKIQPRQVAHLAAAHERGLGRLDIENLLTRRLSL